jgi:hypothetical protein
MTTLSTLCQVKTNGLEATNPKLSHPNQGQLLADLKNSDERMLMNQETLMQLGGGQYESM